MRLLLLAVFLATSIHGNEHDATPLVYDVTTIYRLDEPLLTTSEPRGLNTSGNVRHPGSVEVHARTNARGLPFILQDGTIRDPDVGISVPECSRTVTNCHWWPMTNFTVNKYTTNKKPPLKLDGPELFEYELAESEYTEKHPFHSPLLFNFQTNDQIWYITSGHSYLAVFLVTEGGSIDNDDMYYLRIRHQGEGPAYLVKCTANDYDNNYYMPNDVTRRCRKLMEQDLEWEFTYGEWLSFSVAVTNGRIVLKVYRGMEEITLFDWIDSQPIRVSNVIFGTGLLGGTVKSVNDFPVLELTEETGTILSPPLSPDLDRVCVSLVYYANKDTSVEMQLAQDKTTTTVWTANSDRTKETGDWTHVNVMVAIPRTSTSSEPTVVVKATKQTGSTFLIQRVATCNAEEPEDVLILSEERSLTVQSPGIDVAHNIIYSVVDTNTCGNGGLKVKPKNDLTDQSAGCICPAGFTGENCEKACGANSYGDDCAGVCSETERGCRGMVLCRPLLGCDCAPGFKGLHCNMPCDSGEYGAGCRQSCGECAGGHCDVYSGVCHQGCKAGHFPPLCKKRYKHVSEATRVDVQSFYNVSVSANLFQLAGHGDPQFYQVQYKEKDASDWKLEVPQPMHSSSVWRQSDVGHVTRLKPGTSYLLRVVLIDKSGAIYQGDDVLTTAFSTPCTVPEKADYVNTAANNHELFDFTAIGEDGFELRWEFPSQKTTWCPLIGYEVHVKMGWKWKKYEVSSNTTSMKVYQLLPGKEYTVKVRAVTTKGAAAFSPPRTVTTLERAPDHVVDLKKDDATENSLTVSWSPPRNPSGIVRLYHVTYKCLHLMACPEEDCGDSAGNIEVMSTTTRLEGLLPYALYNISVAGFSVALGPAYSLVIATMPTVPEVAPLAADPDILSRSNSSLVVQWAPPVSCRQLHGYLAAYRYELISPGQQQPLMSGSTTNCSTTFDNLMPYSDYVVRVFVKNSVGWSKSHALEIHSKTKATTSNAVENFTVYKRGRRMLGLRWSAPRVTYNMLQSFSVKVYNPGGDYTDYRFRSPTPCPAWPQLYCFTVEDLNPDTEYKLSVVPRNSEDSSEDGEETKVTVTTKEGAPGAPSHLQIKNRTDTTLTIEWGLPDIINGQLRSFLVNIEETDSVNSSDCCLYFPIREVIVTSEKSAYEYQMTGLKPASSYEVSVSAKTVAMGPAVTTTGHTRPPTPVLTEAPKMAEPVVTGGSLVVNVEPGTGYQDKLVSGYLLLLETDDQGVNPLSLHNKWLSNEIAGHRSVSLIAEFTQAELTTGRKLELHQGSPMVKGRFGVMRLPILKPGTQYRLVWALVMEYCGALSVGQILGETFTVPPS